MRGFSLTEVMIGGAVLGGVALAGAQLFKDRFKNESKLEHETELEIYHSQLQKALSEVGNCNATFQNSYNQTQAPVTEITSIFRCLTNCTEEFAANSVTRVEILREGGIIYNPSAPLQFINAKRTWRIRNIGMVPVTNTGAYYLNMEYQLFSQNADSKAVKKNILVNLRFNNGRFISCASEKESNVESLAQAMCEVFETAPYRGTPHGPVSRWNPSLKRCQFFGSVYSYAQSSDTNDLNPHWNSRSSCSSGYRQGNQIRGIDQGTYPCESISYNVDARTLIDTTESDCMGGRKPVPVYDAGTQKIRVVCQ